jgi:hypothetical protein
MAGALFRGYFAEGRVLNDPEDLTAMAADFGLDPDEVRTFFVGDSATQEVWESQQVATAFGIGGVLLRHRRSLRPSRAAGSRRCGSVRSTLSGRSRSPDPRTTPGGKTEAPAARITTRSFPRSF